MRQLFYKTDAAMYVEKMDDMTIHMKVVLRTLDTGEYVAFLTSVNKQTRCVTCVFGGCHFIIHTIL